VDATVGKAVKRADDFVAVPFRAASHRAARRCHAEARCYENR
jgi:hypothetical protein